MKKLIKYILITTLIAIAFQLVSCSPQKRAQRHIKKALRLDATIKKKDTIQVKDTLLIEEIRKDTVIHLESLRDTFYLQKDRLQVKLIKVSDSVYIEARCDSDTIYYTNEVIVDKIIYKNYPKAISKIIDYWYLFLVGLLIFMYLLARLRNK